MIKPPQIEIPANEPFKHDRLRRKSAIIDLTNLIAGIAQPFSISVSGAFGTGKTSFIRMWQAHLRSVGTNCIYISAWDTDYLDDPLTVVISELESAKKNGAIKFTHDPSDEKWNSFKKKAAAVTARLTPSLGRFAVKAALGPINFVPGIEAVTEKAAELTESALKNVIDKRSEHKSDTQKLHEALSDLVACTNAKSGPQLVVFVDELDRCRPPYAITFLERIKHVLDVSGLLFVFGVDRKQLAHSVCAIYGIGFNSYEYLHRFFDLDIAIQTPDVRAFVFYTLQNMKFEERFKQRSHGGREKDLTYDSIVTWGEILKLSLRSIEQVCLRISALHRLLSVAEDIDPRVLPFLACLRAARHDIYEDYRSGRQGANDLLAILRQDPSFLAFIEDDSSIQFEGYLHCWSLKRGEWIATRQQWQAAAADSNTRQAELRRRFLNRVSDEFLANERRVVFEKLEFVGDLRI